MLARPCSAPDECEEGLFCAAGGELRDLCTRECETAAVCAARFGDHAVCVDGLCAVACDSRADCSEGLACTDGLCVRAAAGDEDDDRDPIDPFTPPNVMPPAIGCPPCVPPTPYCNASRCVQCLRASHCAPELQYCFNDACVQCISGADCGAQAPVCEQGACAACAAHADCGLFPNTPACGPDGRCVACTSDHQTACSDVCDVEQNVCVACLENGDCTDPAHSRCAGRTCQACAADEDCAHIAGRGVCLDGECVECTAEKAAACGTDGEGRPRLCNPQDLTCTDYAAGQSGPCDPCVADAQCQTDHLCMPETYGSSGPVTGHYCMLRWDPAPLVGCMATVNPRRQFVTATSIDGVTAEVCTFWLSTCQAHADFGSACSGDTDCGAEDVYDGLCAPGGCTVRCQMLEDCPDLNTCTPTGECAFQ